MQELGGQRLIIERVSQPRGVLLTFHGCSHSALDWWPKQPACESCVGGHFLKPPRPNLGSTQLHAWQHLSTRSSSNID